MLLKLLIDRAKGLDLPPSLYQEQLVQWRIDLREDGTPIRIVPLSGEDEGRAAGRRLTTPALPKQRTVKITPILLTDRADYVLGLVGEDGKPDRIAEQHEAFKALVQECAETTRAAGAIAVHRFLQTWDPENPTLDLNGVGERETVSFSVEGEDPALAPEVQRFWRDSNRDPGDPEMECLACGEVGPVVQRVPEPIKGLAPVGGQTSGVPLISANNKAFLSYGHKASATSPICLACAEAAAKSLNQLLSDERHRLYLGDTAMVMWSTSGDGEDIMDLLTQPDPKQVKQLFNATTHGRAASIKEEQFHVVGLGAAGARLILRDLATYPLGELEQNLASWFQVTGLMDPQTGSRRKPHGLYALLSSLANESGDVPPTFATAVVHAAMGRSPLPPSLLRAAIRRNQTERRVTAPRAAIMKAYLIRQQDLAEDELMTLETERDDPAYLCGRLLAELEAIQANAQGNPNATLVDRFYGAASSAPATTFGPLMKNAQAHLSKLRKGNGGGEVWHQRRLQDILDALPDFPATLNIQEQALFGLGYYHQRADRFRKRSSDKAQPITETNPTQEAE